MNNDGNTAIKRLNFYLKSSFDQDLKFANKNQQGPIDVQEVWQDRKKGDGKKTLLSIMDKKNKKNNRRNERIEDQEDPLQLFNINDDLSF